MTPAEVCEKLGIQSSTLRKYSLLFEKEQIVFERNKNNSRIYTVMQAEAIQEAMTLSQNGGMTLEEAVMSASKALKAESVITAKEGVTAITPQRHDADIAAVMLDEIKSLKEELKKSEERQAEQQERLRERDMMFAEALESLHKEINELKALQQPQQDGVVTTDTIEDEVITNHPTEKKVSWIRSIFSKKN